MSPKRPRQKHIPQRTCVICRQKQEKRQLVRLVCTPDEGVVIDPTGKRNGRGAYLCTDPACWDRALQGQLLDRALRCQISEANREVLAQQRPAGDPAENATVGR
jgi:uncharacterized protein